jgi:hypothetical protein
MRSDLQGCFRRNIGVQIHELRSASGVKTTV